MRVLVTGSRKFSDKTLMQKAFAIHKPTLVIHGAARGADTLAGELAAEQHIQVLVFHADWKQHGRAAGPIRNKLMFDSSNPDIVIAFPLSNSVGTWHMVNYARQKGCKVVVYGE